MAETLALSESTLPVRTDVCEACSHRAEELIILQKEYPKQSTPPAASEREFLNLWRLRMTPSHQIIDLYASPNGDRWLFDGRTGGELVVCHYPNQASEELFRRLTLMSFSDKTPWAGTSVTRDRSGNF